MRSQHTPPTHVKVISHYDLTQPSVYKSSKSSVSQ
jgi:hypothetical protein